MSVLDYETPKPPKTATVEQDWKQELARDFLAVGSWVFYVLIVGRALLMPYRPFSDHAIVGAILLIVAALAYRDFHPYIARAFVLGVSVIIFYENLLFSAFIVVCFIGLYFASAYLGATWRQMLAGTIIGVICMTGAYFVGNLTRTYVLPDIGRIPAHRSEAVPADGSLRWAVRWDENRRGTETAAENAEAGVDPRMNTGFHRVQTSPHVRSIHL